MSQAPTELVVISKMYDLLLWTCRHVEKFPRSYKFTIGDRLVIRLQEICDLIKRAGLTPWPRL